MTMTKTMIKENLVRRINFSDSPSPSPPKRHRHVFPQPMGYIGHFWGFLYTVAEKEKLIMRKVDLD